MKRIWLVALAVCLTFGLTGCPKKPTVKPGQDTGQTVAANGGTTGSAAGAGAGAARPLPSVGGGSPGDAGTTLATGQAQPSLLAVDADSIYWTNAGDGSVVSVPKGGGPTTPIAQGQGSPFGIAVNASGVYWTDQTGTVMKAPLGGGALVTLASGQSNPYAIALDGTSVYFTSYASNGSVMKLTESCSCP